MKRITLILLVAFGLVAASAGTAEALSNPTCAGGNGSSVDNLTHIGPPSTWSIVFSINNCSTGKTVNVFVQVNNGGTWQAVASQQFTQPADHGNPWQYFLGAPACSGSNTYRGKLVGNGWTVTGPNHQGC